MLASLSLNNSVVFEFENTKGKPDPKVEKLPNLPGPHTWLASMFRAKCNYRQQDLAKTFKEGNVVLLPDSTISDRMDATHQGIMQYMFHAWARELGVVLKPDMFFFT